MLLNKFLVSVSSSEVPAFEHHKLMNQQTLCGLSGERSFPIGVLVEFPSAWTDVQLLKSLICKPLISYTHESSNPDEVFIWTYSQGNLISYREQRLVAAKPVLGISDKVSFKPVSSATETSYKMEISPVAS